MKRKIFFILSSFGAGGAERVFWLLSQNFNKSKFDVTVVLLSTENAFFSTELEDVRVIDLNTKKASRSFLQLIKLLRIEKPDAIFCTGGEINLLVGITSFFVNIPVIIARPTNQDNSKFLSLKAKTLKLFSKILYSRFQRVICQSKEIKDFMLNVQRVPEHKLLMVPNPVALGKFFRSGKSRDGIVQLIVVARLTPQKGIIRLINILKTLPGIFTLTVVGDGVQKNEIDAEIIKLGLSDRVKMLGRINNVLEVISKHDLFVLPSYIEGFPNVVIESLSVGTPVISFEVGGINEIIKNDFNGFIVKQDDLNGFGSKVIAAAKKDWKTETIIDDIYKRYSVENVVKSYENLVLDELK